eukprot:CAMPEP_0116009448 /NCGR_PEP_ID=MMETSP0321-20121206/3437_1 /TAXON_ID=163516 /ORGANISM="Leptocylindrus danicus var. danicus, Strain B650" /LENGTH=185 /DNA_ID=CAMNT_0003478409 /DNA_START=8 /DNA_END=565 /DNA_ORIENTATION=+
MSSRYGIPVDDDELDDQDHCQPLSPAQERFLREAFDLYDHEKIGEIEISKIVNLIRAILGQYVTKTNVMVTLNSVLPPEQSKSVNQNENCMVSLPNFLRVMVQYDYANSHAREEKQLRRVFELFDEVGKGYITVHELASIVEGSSSQSPLNEDFAIDHEYLNVMIDEFVDNGKVTFDVFQKIMQA